MQMYLASVIFADNSSTNYLFNYKDDAYRYLSNIITDLIVKDFTNMANDDEQNYYSYLINELIRKNDYVNVVLTYNTLPARLHNYNSFMVTEYDLFGGILPQIKSIPGVDSNRALTYMGTPFVPTNGFIYSGGSGMTPATPPTFYGGGGLIYSGNSTVNIGNWAKNTVYPISFPASAQPLVKQAASGATCRGPHGNPYHSEYAVPDRDDGTFVCSQCKMFLID